MYNAADTNAIKEQAINTVLELIVRDGQVELPPDVRITKNTRVLLVLLEDGEQPKQDPAPIIPAAKRTEAWQRLRGIAATDSEPPMLNAESQIEIVRRLRGIAKPDGPPPPDEEIREMYTDYLAKSIVKDFLGHLTPPANGLT